MKFEALKDKKRAVILSTDISSDCDDVGAIAALHSYVREHGLDVIGMCNCTSNRNGTKTLYAMNKFFGRENILLGEYKEHTLPSVAEYSAYTEEIGRRFGEGAPEPMSAVDFYRSLLSEAEDDSVIIITIGFYTDMAQLLASGADKYSELSGIELVRRKVSYIVSMAAKYPKGLEYNIRLAPTEAKYFFDNVPVNVYISDWCLGHGMRTGFNPEDKERLANNPVFETYRLFSKAFNVNFDNNSYDLTAIQFAVEGEGKYYRVNPTPYKLAFFTEKDHQCESYTNNSTEFVECEDGNVFLIEAVDKELIKNELNKRIAQ